MSISPHSITAPEPVAWLHEARQQAFDIWFASLPSHLALDRNSLRPASADASFRRYFRVNSAAGTYVVMDAPPEHEDSDPFVRIAALLESSGIKAPKVLAWDRASGFLLLTDLGSKTLLQTIQTPGADAYSLYLKAVDTLVLWQTASRADVLPAFDHALMRREMDLFPDWYVAQHRGHALDEQQTKTINTAFECVIEHNLRWPRVFVHADFNPRNLMVDDTVNGAGDARLGVLDFQDAVYGPITYDIASLMRDALVSWEEAFCLDITIRYWEKARKAGLPVGDDFGEFYRGVEWMGLQRHLKVAGLFARLSLRDGKPQYLADSPRFIHYLQHTCSRYRELKPLLRLIEKIDGIQVPEAFAFGRV